MLTRLMNLLLSKVAFRESTAVLGLGCSRAVVVERYHPKQTHTRTPVKREINSEKFNLNLPGWWPAEKKNNRYIIYETATMV